MTRKVDVAIIGGGVAGLSLAYFLAPRRSVVVLERESALGYHATGRSAAEFTRRFHTPLVGRLAAISHAFLADPPEGFAQAPLLKPRGIVIVADAERKARLEDVFARESAGAPELEWLESPRALERVPILNPDFVAGAFHDPDCWDMDVDGLLQAYARGARAAGAEIVTTADCISRGREPDGWVIETTAGEVRAPIVVNAAGGWADTVASLFGVAPLGIRPLRRTAILVDPPAGVDVARLPEIADVDDAFYIKPDAGRLLVSPADETPTDPCDAQAEEVDVALAAWHLERATTVPVRHVAHAWAGLRSFAPDRAPVVGFSAMAEGFFWLAGQGGFGILSSPALGRFSAELIAGGAPSPDFAEQGVTRDMLSPRRLEGSF